MDYALRAPRQSPRKIEFPSFTASGESCTTRNCHRDAARSESETNNWKMRKKIRSDVDYMSTMTISSVSNVESSNSIRDWKFTQSSEIRSIVSRRLMELWNNSNFSSSKLTQSSFKSSWEVYLTRNVFFWRSWDCYIVCYFEVVKRLMLTGAINDFSQHLKIHSSPRFLSHPKALSTRLDVSSDELCNLSN